MPDVISYLRYFHEFALKIDLKMEWKVPNMSRQILFDEKILVEEGYFEYGNFETCYFELISKKTNSNGVKRGHSIPYHH